MKKTCQKCGAILKTGKKFCSMKCRGHTGFRPGGTYRMCTASREEKIARLRKSFEKNVIRQEFCWDWKGPINRGGYTVMTCNKQNGAETGHRASWMLYKGDIPKFKHICHSCDNRRCTNPEHLWIGTHQENNADKISKGRGAKNSPPIMKGSENPSAKLTTDQVMEIKKLILSGVSCSSIGRKFLVSKQTILRIKNGKNWTHLKVE